MIKKYVKIPVIIEAIQFEGNNQNEIQDFMSGYRRYYRFGLNFIIIETLKGDMKANIGDYIIKDVKGEFYPCKPDIFELTYKEKTNESQD